jgi:hypothetical protein
MSFLAGEQVVWRYIRRSDPRTARGCTYFVVAEVVQAGPLRVRIRILLAQWHSRPPLGAAINLMRPRPDRHGEPYPGR